MAITIGRRHFISALGGAAAAWPLAARAQQRANPIIGFLNSRSPGDSTHLVAAFHRGLAENGMVDGQNVTVDFRWALGNYERLPQLAAELVRLPVNVIAATGGEPSALAAKAATSNIPIVFAVGSDPIKMGLVTSYSRPTGNLTGVNILTRALEAKRIGLVRELAPQAKTIGLLINTRLPASETVLVATQEAAREVGLQLEIMRASTDQEIDAAFEIVTQKRIEALAVGADAFFDTRRAKLVALAGQKAVPTIFQFREYAAAGGLMSYGIDLPDVYRHVADYAARILKGTKPADLPVLEPTKFEFVINLKTAKMLGIKISDNLLSLADEVIE
jgi:putative ABC transport system substrate-binding protein